jgi:hypothetical protein
MPNPAEDDCHVNQDNNQYRTQLFALMRLSNRQRSMNMGAPHWGKRCPSGNNAYSSATAPRNFIGRGLIERRTRRASTGYVARGQNSARPFGDNRLRACSRPPLASLLRSCRRRCKGAASLDADIKRTPPIAGLHETRIYAARYHGRFRSGLHFRYQRFLTLGEFLTASRSILADASSGTAPSPLPGCGASRFR